MGLDHPLNATNAEERRYWRRICVADTSLPICEYVEGYYHYEIWAVPNILFAVLFFLSLAGFVASYAIRRRALSFSVAISLGVVLEILGYGARVWSWKVKWDDIPFLMQIVCLTIAPAFLAAAIYLCLRRIVYAFGPANSRMRPEYYTRIFIPCDIVSLVLQSMGGAMTSSASRSGESTKTGDGIMLAGLIFQIITMFFFMLAASDFGLRVWRRHRLMGSAAFSSSPDGSSSSGAEDGGAMDNRLAKLRTSLRFRGFLAALVLAMVCIFWRSAYRVAELSGGWNGPLTARQDYFVAFEGVMIVIGCLGLNVFHPAHCDEGLWSAQGGLGKKGRKARQSAAAGELVAIDGVKTERAGASASDSEAGELAAARKKRFGR